MLIMKCDNCHLEFEPKATFDIKVESRSKEFPDRTVFCLELCEECANKVILDLKNYCSI